MRTHQQLLRLASFTRGNIKPGKGAELRLEWAKEEAPLRLTAAPIVPNLYYRMDTLTAANSNNFTWTLDVVKAAHVDLRELGYLLRSSQDVYIPVANAGTAATQTVYSFVVASRIVVRNFKAQVLDPAEQSIYTPSVPSPTIARDGTVAFTIPVSLAAGVFTLHLEAKCLEGCDGKDVPVVSDYVFQIP